MNFILYAHLYGNIFSDVFLAHGHWRDTQHVMAGIHTLCISQSCTIVAAVPVVVATPPTTISGPAASIEDAPICTVNILAVMVSQKLKKQLSEVPLSKLIKELSNGKSTLQNEIMGDL